MTTSRVVNGWLIEEQPPDGMAWRATHLLSGCVMEYAGSEWWAGWTQKPMDYVVFHHPTDRSATFGRKMTASISLTESLLFRDEVIG